MARLQGEGDRHRTDNPAQRRPVSRATANSLGRPTFTRSLGSIQMTVRRWRFMSARAAAFGWPA
jgi:hypothetical protein